MSKLSVKEIRTEVHRLFERHPGGMRRGDVVTEITEMYPETPRGTIATTVSTYLNGDDDFEKTGYAFFKLQLSEAAVHTEPSDPVIVVHAADSAKQETVTENDFYKPFGDWLRDDAAEVTEAVALGGIILRGKWNTPDVIGTLRSKPSDLFKFETIIVSAEIKVDANQAITAFGQAASY